jgi:hypothetical protein
LYGRILEKERVIQILANWGIHNVKPEEARLFSGIPRLATFLAQAMLLGKSVSDERDWILWKHSTALDVLAKMEAHSGQHVERDPKISVLS